MHETDHQEGTVILYDAQNQQQCSTSIKAIALSFFVLISNLKHWYQLDNHQLTS